MEERNSWIKDKTYFLKKCNTLKNEIKTQREAHAQNTLAWTKQIEEFKASEEHKDMKLKLANKEIRRLKERVKELENGKTRK